MSATSQRFGSIDEYIATFPINVQEILERIRQTIQQVAPDTVETISYQMPTFKLNGGDLVYVSAWKKHIGLYPVPLGAEDFQKELAPYLAAKSTARFPLNKPIPYDLIENFVRLRITEAR